MHKLIVIIITSCLIVGCASKGNLPPVSGALEPVNSPEVMNNVER